MANLRTCARLTAVTLLTLAVSTLTACATWSNSLEDPAVNQRHVKSTVVNNHGHAVLALASAGGDEWRLGYVRAGEQRTFQLPGGLDEATRYYLVADCELTGQRVVSERIEAAPGIRPHFMVGENDLASYVRMVRVSSGRERP